MINKQVVMSPHERHAFDTTKILHPQFKWYSSSKTPHLPQKYQSVILYCIVFLTANFCFI